MGRGPGSHSWGQPLKEAVIPMDRVRKWGLEPHMIVAHVGMAGIGKVYIMKNNGGRGANQVISYLKLPARDCYHAFSLTTGIYLQENNW